MRDEHGSPDKDSRHESVRTQEVEMASSSAQVKSLNHMGTFFPKTLFHDRTLRMDFVENSRCGRSRPNFC